MRNLVLFGITLITFFLEKNVMAQQVIDPLKVKELIFNLDPNDDPNKIKEAGLEFNKLLAAYYCTINKDNLTTEHEGYYTVKIKPAYTVKNTNQSGKIITEICMELITKTAKSYNKPISPIQRDYYDIDCVEEQRSRGNLFIFKILDEKIVIGTYRDPVKYKKVEVSKTGYEILKMYENISSSETPIKQDKYLSEASEIISNENIANKINEAQSAKLIEEFSAIVKTWPSNEKGAEAFAKWLCGKSVSYILGKQMGAIFGKENPMVFMYYYYEEPAFQNKFCSLYDADASIDKSVKRKTFIEGLYEGIAPFHAEPYQKFLEGQIASGNKVTREFYFKYALGPNEAQPFFNAVYNKAPESFPVFLSSPGDLEEKKVNVTKDQENKLFNIFIEYYKNKSIEMTYNFVKWSIEKGKISSAEDATIMNILKQGITQLKAIKPHASSISAPFVDVIAEYKISKFNSDIVGLLSHANPYVRIIACNLCGILVIKEAKDKLRDLYLFDTFTDKIPLYDEFGNFIGYKTDYWGREILYYPVREAAERALSYLP
ncbi:MAG: hypothetical protein N2Z72_01625 [Bacteroidales bacterium]|nr:hypothetical protein [Bacteroidales bacterium]